MTWDSHAEAIEAVATGVGSTTAYIFWQPIAIGVIVVAHAIYRLVRLPVAPPVDPNR